MPLAGAGMFIPVICQSAPIVQQYPTEDEEYASLNNADCKAVYTGTGWVAEITRKLNTGNADDVVFNISEELPFGFAIFNNAAIAHGIKPGLTIKFEQ